MNAFILLRGGSAGGLIYGGGGRVLVCLSAGELVSLGAFSWLQMSYVSSARVVFWRRQDSQRSVRCGAFFMVSRDVTGSCLPRSCSGLPH